MSSVNRFCSKCEILVLNYFCEEFVRSFSADGFWLFITTPLSIIKALRARTGRILRFCRVKLKIVG